MDRTAVAPADLWSKRLRDRPLLLRWCVDRYVTKQEARNAFDQLSTTHFYGRKLVVQWAAEKQGLEGLRKKALKDMGAVNDAHGKQREQAWNEMNKGAEKPGEFGF